QRELAAPVEREPVPELMPVLPAAGKILRSQRAEDTRVTRFELANGAVVSFRPARPGAGRAYLTVLPESGWLDTESPAANPAGGEQADVWNRSHAGQVVQRGGVGEWDAPTLGRILEGKSTEVRLGPELTATSVTEDLELTLQLVHLYMTTPRRDPAAFAALLAEEQARRSPRQQFESALPSDPGLLASVSGASLDGALRVHAQRYANASRLRIVLVADVEQGRLRSLVERYFASLPGTDSGQATAPTSGTAREVDGPGNRPAPRRVQTVRLSGRGGHENQVMLRFAGTATPSAEARVEFFALQTHLRRRMRQRLREELGGVYDVDVTGGWAGASFWQEVRFECKPERTQELHDAAYELIAELSQRALSDTERSPLVAGYTGTFPGAFQSDEFWHTELVHAVAEGADPRRILELPALASRITAPALLRAAQRYLPIDDYVDTVWSAQ
ncbi:MAG: hypothetical protein RL033_183, partial [Pseudomonadota bacterium]